MRGRKPLHIFIVSMLVLVLAGLTGPAGAAPPPLLGGSGDLDNGVTGGGQSLDRSGDLADLDAMTGRVVSEGPTASFSKNLEVVGRGERLLPTGTTDVWPFRGYAYLGTFNAPCGTGEGYREDTGPVDLVDDVEAPGVVIFNVKNVNKPTYVGNLPSVAGSRVNDVKVERMNGSDILVHSNEPCAGGPGGFELYNVDDPRNPVHLAHVQTDDINAFLRDALGFVDFGVHNLFLFMQGDRAYVAANVTGEFGNFQVFDITDPTTPELVAWWGAERLRMVELGLDPDSVPDLGDAEFDIILDLDAYLFSGFGSSANRFLHDFTISADGTKAWLANWDAGLVLLDISDIRNPELISVALDPTAGDGEVNSHAIWPSEDGSIVVETEEDFDAIPELLPLGNWTVGEWPWNTIPAIGISTGAGDDFEANQTGNVVRIEETLVHHTIEPQLTVLSGSLAGTVYPAAEASGNQPKLSDVGVIEAEAVFVGQGCDTDNFADPTIDVPGVVDPHLNDPDGKIAIVRRGGCSFTSKLGAAQAAGAIAVVVSNNVRGTSQWGNVRIWDYSDPANPVLASEFDTICSLDPTDESCDLRGTYSVHNVIVEKGKAYFSWYSDGVVILDISDPYNPVETARWNPTGEEFEMQNGGIQDVWGIGKERGKPWLYASDRNGGLYILKEFGSGTANKGGS